MESRVNTKVVFLSKKPMQSEGCVKDLKEETIYSELEERNLQISLINQTYVQSSDNNFQIKDRFESTEEVKCVNEVEKLEIKEEPLEYTFCEDEYLNNQSDQVQCVANKILIKDSDYKTGDMIDEGAEKKYMEKLGCTLEDKTLIANDINDLNIASDVSDHSNMTCKLEMPHESAINEEQSVSNSNVQSISGKQIHINESDGNDICDKQFRSNGFLSNHMLKSADKNLHKCGICGKCFNRKSNLNVHIKKHTGERPFQCDICGKCFSYRGSLNVHKKTHTGEKPFKCDICGKYFTYGCLGRHMKRHTGKRPFQCDTCGEWFSEKCILKVHMRIHTGEKPFKCNICERYFSDKSILNNHMRTHTGEKPFKCDSCGHCFRQKRKLNAYIRTHCDERRFKCVTCEKCFKRKRDLRMHTEIHTAD